MLFSPQGFRMLLAIDCGNTNIVFVDTSSSYTMTEANATFTDATTSMTSAITLFE